MSDRTQPSRGRRRTAARLAAVQALYQLEVGGGSATKVIGEFTRHRLGQEIEGVPVVDADRELFGDLVLGVTQRCAELDRVLDTALEKGWSVPRLEIIMRAILRAGAYEITSRPDIDAALSVNEYVEIAGSFFGGREPAFVNGVLDRIARDRAADSDEPALRTNR